MDSIPVHPLSPPVGSEDILDFNPSRGKSFLPECLDTGLKVPQQLRDGCEEGRSGVRCPSTANFQQGGERIMRVGHVYFVKNSESGLIKIGRTHQEVYRRIISIRSECREHTLGKSVNGLFSVKCLATDDLEHSFHILLKDYHFKGEWFKINEQQLFSQNGLYALASGYSSSGEPYIERKCQCCNRKSGNHLIMPLSVVINSVFDIGLAFVCYNCSIINLHKAISVMLKNTVTIKLCPDTGSVICDYLSLPGRQ